MNKIEELLEKLCPNGVEYKKLEECCHILDNKRKPITKSKRKPGKYPYYGANGIQDYVEDYIFDGKFVLVGEDGSVINKNGNPIVTWAEDKIWVNNHAHIIEEIDGVSLRYLFHYLQIVDVTKLVHGSIPKLLQGDFRNLQIAVPPLEIQCEIVRILDKFTELIALLKAELKTRKQQYEYYREKILNNKNVDYKTLKELATNCDNLRKPVTSVDREKGDYPYYGASGIIDYVNDYIFDGDYLLISEDGANLVSRKNPIAFSIKGKNWVNNHAHVLKFENKYIQKYVEIYLNYIKLDKYITRATQPKLNQENLNKIIIPIPNDNNNELKWIVDILSNFEKLCNDLTAGIPAEIEARQKQYEYYRDKLLTFKELKNK